MNLEDIKKKQEQLQPINQIKRDTTANEERITEHKQQSNQITRGFISPQKKSIRQQLASAEAKINHREEQEGLSKTTDSHNRNQSDIYINSDKDSLIRKKKGYSLER